MSDRIILMRRGRIEQCGTPEDLFDRPSSRFAAEFMGFDNVLPCTVQAVTESGEATVDFNGTTLRGVCASGSHPRQGDIALFAVRAERLTPAKRTGPVSASNVIACAPAEHLYRGKYTDQTALTPDSARLKIRSWDQSATPGEFDAVTCRVQDCVILPH
jgi:spermidine/putrescine transport system ATP-binding protein